MENNKDLSLISFNTDYHSTIDDKDDSQKINHYNISDSNNQKTVLTLKVFYEFIESLNGNNEILLCNFKRDIKLDVILQRKKYCRIYGHAINENNVFYKDVLIRLFKYEIEQSNVRKKEIDKTFTNLSGEFNFIIEGNFKVNDFRVEIDDAYREF